MQAQLLAAPKQLICDGLKMSEENDTVRELKAGLVPASATRLHFYSRNSGALNSLRSGA